MHPTPPHQAAISTLLSALAAGAADAAAQESARAAAAASRFMAAAEAVLAAGERAVGGRAGAACYFGLLDVAHAARDRPAAQRVAALIR